jgi:hypothetical protein
MEKESDIVPWFHAEKVSSIIGRHPYGEEKLANITISTYDRKGKNIEFMNEPYIENDNEDIYTIIISLLKSISILVESLSINIELGDVIKDDVNKIVKSIIKLCRKDGIDFEDDELTKVINKISKIIYSILSYGGDNSIMRCVHSMSELLDITTDMIKKEVFSGKSSKQPTQILELYGNTDMERGKNMEKIILHEFASLARLKLSYGSHKRTCHFKSYMLTGVPDGVDASTGNVIEIKSRNKKPSNKSFNEYDIIQLRCYMLLHGKVDGVLIESYPDKNPYKFCMRWCRVKWSEKRWIEIHDALVDASDRHMSQTKPE